LLSAAAEELCSCSTAAAAAGA
jgi:hypothetical protein